MKLSHREYLFGIGIAAIMLGLLVYGWRSQRPSFPDNHLTIMREKNNHSPKTVTIHCWSGNQLKNEQKTIVWSSSPQEWVTNLVQAWLSMMDEEELLAHPCALQSATVSLAEREIFISFDRSPLSSAWSTYDALMTLESLLQTLRDNDIKITHIRFLENHQPLQDNHLDFSKPWPLEGFLNQTKQQLPQPSYGSNKRCVIIIDPAGDATVTGRIIDDSFERGITLQYAQSLQKSLQQELPHATITVARLPGEQVEPFRNAILANRLPADLYISINCYAETQQPARCLIAYSRWHQFDDTVATKPSLSLIPYYDAYKISIQQSCLAAQLLKTTAEQQKNSGYTYQVAGIPCKNLAGITVPALSLEFGLSTRNGWQTMAPAMAHALVPVIETLLAMKD